ncbi:hypothetical protein BB560_002581 [Smittium megazygosporum]|uniref:Uncharacterized protein n=1 Tax=Smittium megazygosporum TaxID=133381 RepID=A0A2T9ZEH6_9FUNG|nr:hypothetical protein BB560_002581 [Smittium megazygosporum]
MFKAYECLFWLLLVSNGVLSSLASKFELKDKEMSLFRRQGSAVVDTSKFKKRCSADSEVSTTFPLMPLSADYKFTGAGGSGVYSDSVTIFSTHKFKLAQCSSGYFYITFDVEFDTVPPFWSVALIKYSKDASPDIRVEYRHYTETGDYNIYAKANEHEDEFAKAFWVGKTTCKTKQRYFILHDETGSKIGSTDCFTNYNNDTTVMNNFKFDEGTNAYFTCDSSANGSMKNIQVNCLEKDICLNATITDAASPDAAPPNGASPDAASPDAAPLGAAPPLGASPDAAPLGAAPPLGASPDATPPSAAPLANAISTFIVSTTVSTTITQPTTVPTTIYTTIAPFSVPTFTTTTTELITDCSSAAQIVSTIRETVTTTIPGAISAGTVASTTVTASPIVKTETITTSTNIASATNNLPPEDQIISDSMTVKSLKSNKNYSENEKINIPCSGDFTLSLTSNSRDSDLFFGFADANGVGKNGKYVELQVGLKGGRNTAKDLAAVNIKLSDLLKRDESGKINLIYVNGIYSFLSNGQSFTTFKGSKVVPKSLTITPFNGTVTLSKFVLTCM